MKTQKPKIYYKLTNQDLTTYNGFKWKVGEWNKASGEGNLCGKGWFHFYHSKDLAILLNPIHADIKNPILWEAECRGKSFDDNGLKIGWTEARIIKKIPLPRWTLIQKIAFGILCAKEVYYDKDWNNWADKWLSGENRKIKDAAAVAREIRAVRIVEWAAVAATKAVEWEMRTVEWAAEAVEWAAEKNKNTLDFNSIIKQAKKIK